MSGLAALPAPLVERIVEETKRMAVGHFGFDLLPATAEVFGPASYFEIFAAYEPERVSLSEEARDCWPFYLVVLRGQFVPRQFTAGAPPRSIATLIWSPTEEPLQYGLRNNLPEAMSRLGSPRTISLD